MSALVTFFSGVVFFLVMGGFEVPADELQVNDHPSTPMGLVGSFHTDPMQKPSIEDVQSWGNYLYVTGRYINGDQVLEVWNVRDPQNPVRQQTLTYGNIKQQATDHWQFPYMSIFDNTLLVRSDFSEALYTLTPDGQLTEGEYYDFADSVSGIINNEESLFLSHAGSYGCYFGRLFDPYDVLPQQEYGYSILNFTNPQRPFMASTVPSTTSAFTMEVFNGHINAILENVPGTLTTGNNRIRFSGRVIEAQSHIEVFWQPRLPEIFNPALYQRTLRDQIEQVVQAQSVSLRLDDAIEQYFDSLAIEADRTVEGALRQTYALTDPGKVVLENYGITIDDSLRLAIFKAVKHDLTLSLDTRLSTQLISPLFQDWMETLFVIPIASKEVMLDEISTILHHSLTPSTVARYLLDNYIAPYSDIPDWMFWDMNELVDHAVDSDPGQIADQIIRAANQALLEDNLIEEALALVPAAQQFYLPAGFPENARDLLEYAFFEHGAKLDREGLAFMEMLKFYQYYSGNDDYLNYEHQFAVEIKRVQEELIQALLDTITPFMDALAFAGDLSERLHDFSETVSIGDAVALAISDAVCARIEGAGFDVDARVNDIALQLDLYLTLDSDFGISERDLASVNDLLLAIQNDFDLSSVQLKTLWDEGKDNTLRLEQAYCKALHQILQEAWGEVDLDVSVLTAIYEFIGNHIDYRWTFGHGMDEILKEYVYSALTTYPGFIDFIDVWQRAYDGDVIARWQVTFEIAKTIAALAEFTQTLSLKLEAIELALEESYQQITAAAVKTLMMEFATIMAQDMFGSFSKWATRTRSVEYSFDTSTLTTLKPVRTEAFAWENRIGIVPRESWNYMTPRRMGLVLFDPKNPAETKAEAILESGWGTVDYVHAHDGVVMIGGSNYDGIWPKPTALFLVINENQVDAFYFRGAVLASAEGMLTANHNGNIVLYGPGGIFLFTNPRQQKEGFWNPPTRVQSWELY